MNAIGLLLLFVGGFLWMSAAQNKSPLKTLRSIITDPSQARTTLTTREEEYSSGSSFGGGGSFGNGGSVQGGSFGGGGSFGTASPAVGKGADAAIAFARAQLGDPYDFGATGPDRWDCSGLVQGAYRAAGISLPRTTQQMVLSTKLTPVSRADLIPGDLVFPTIGHVGIYTGNGNIIDAPRAGSFVKERPIWGFWTARRIK